MATKRLNYVEIWNDHQKGMTKEEIAKKYKCTSEAVRRVLFMGSAFADSIGTPTGFQDKNGKDIKTADRIKHTVDGSILTIDKFARAVSPLGFKYDLLSMHVQRGMNADGTYYSRLSDYELTDEVPPKHEGEVVRLGTDADNMAPDRVRDPRNERLHGPKRRKGALRDLEAEAVQDGCTPEEARRILTLQDYQDEDLCDELRDRGYHGEITKTKTIKI